MAEDAPVNAAQLDAFFRRHGSPLAGHGGAFIQAGQKYGFDPRLLVAISGAESSLGVHAAGHNPFGWGPGIHFANWGQAIDTVARGLKTNYLDKGLTTVDQIQQKWAPQHVANDPTGLNSNWAKNVKHFLQQLGGMDATTGLPTGGTTTTSRTVSGTPDLSGFGQLQLSNQQAGHRVNAVQSLNDLTQMIRSTPNQTVRETAPTVNSTVSGGIGKVILSKGADRAGVHTKAPVLQFARQIAALYGMPLAIGTGTNHSRLTVDGNVSDHWSGNAVDIPATGAKLLRLGRLALIAAGMPRAEAMKQKGGLYNIGGHQVIFLTRQGGNHFNHLHISAH